MNKIYRKPFAMITRWLALFALLSITLQAQAAALTDVSARLERQLNINPSLLLELDNPEVVSFYRERDYAPMWFDTEGRLRRTEELVKALQSSVEDGLEPSEYFLDELLPRLDARSVDNLIELELWSTAALYRYANDLYSGRLDPFAIDADWHIKNTRLDVDEFFKRLSEQESIAKWLDELAPTQKGYRSLRAQLKRYREISDSDRRDLFTFRSWPRLETGVTHDEVNRLRRRLQLEGDLDARAVSGKHFDAALKQALERYQSRHGLIVTGRADTKTLAALNISLTDRIEQIRLNMERQRWLPRELGHRHIAVNMTGFELAVIRGEEVELSMPVVIGKPFRETPALNGIISSVVYNPYWTIPKSVMWEKFIPAQINNPDYLRARSIKVFKGWAEPVEVDPRSIDWTALHPERNSPYWMRQEPGAGNALGNIKFLFPNDYRIYLHGSPEKHLFDRHVRTYSLGCIRVKDPETLAEYLQGGPDVSIRQSVASSLSDGRNRKQFLSRGIPVYLMYWTAWVDETGDLNFRDDIYGRDARLRESLQALASAV